MTLPGWHTDPMGADPATTSQDATRRPGWDPPVPPRHRPHALLIFPLAFVLAAGGLGAWRFLGDDDEPAEWEPRVLPLVEFVERERGLEFDHAVPVDFLSDAEWEQEVRTEESDLTAEERRDDEQAVELMRALGLAEGEVDLLEEANELSTDFVLAFFDPDADRVSVHAEPGTELDVHTQVTLVHELTHALQHQHYDLATILEETEEGSELAVRGLIEGDATNVESAFVATRSQAEQDEYFDRESEVSDPTEDAPAALVVMLGAPYALGPQLASMLDELDRLDRAFAELPSTEEHLLDPVSFVEDDHAEDVDPPELPRDADELDEGEFGAIGLFAVLSERIDPYRALEAADGWGGDVYRTYRVGDRTCFRAQFQGETETDTTRIQRALDDWVLTLPSPFASVRVDGGQILLESCDPGSETELATGDSYDALVVPASRAVIESEAIAGGMDPTAARCTANGVLAETTLDDLLDEESQRFMTEAWQQRVVEIATSCEGA
jgi:hypothetical protein